MAFAASLSRLSNQADAEFAERVATFQQVPWQWQDDSGQWKNYKPEESSNIENAYRQYLREREGSTIFRTLDLFSGQSHRVKIDFEKFHQYGFYERLRAIRRCPTEASFDTDLKDQDWCWEWDAGQSGWQQYNRECCQQLEKAYAQGEVQCAIRINYCDYIVDFATWKQRSRYYQSSAERKVVRKKAVSSSSESTHDEKVLGRNSQTLLSSSSTFFSAAIMSPSTTIGEKQNQKVNAKINAYTDDIVASFMQQCEAAARGRERKHQASFTRKVNDLSQLQLDGTEDSAADAVCAALQAGIAMLGFVEVTVNRYQVHQGRRLKHGNDGSIDQNYRFTISVSWAEVDDDRVGSDVPGTSKSPTAVGAAVPCPICFETRSAVALFPCGHTVCNVCARSLVNQPCPSCRQRVSGNTNGLFIG